MANLKLEIYSNKRGWFECTGEVSLSGVKYVEKGGNYFIVHFWTDKEASVAYDKIGIPPYCDPISCVGKIEYTTIKRIKIQPFEGCQLKAVSKELSFYETI